MPPRKPNRKSTTQTKSSNMPLEAKKKKKAPVSKKKKSDSPSIWLQIKDFVTSKRLHFILGIILFFFVIYLSASMVSYFFTGAEDQSIIINKWEQITTDKHNIKNISSVSGALLAHIIIDKGFGVGSFAILFFLTILAFRLFGKRLLSLWKSFFHAVFWLIWTSLALGFVDIIFQPQLFFKLGGEHGVAVSQWLISFIGQLGFSLGMFGVLLIYSIIVSIKTIDFLQNLFKLKRKNEEDNKEETDDFEEDENGGLSVAIGTEIVPEDWIQTADNEEYEEEITPSKEESNVAFEVAKQEFEELVDDDRNENEDPYYNLEKLGKFDPTLELSRYQFPTLDLLKTYGKENATHIDMEEQNANKERITNTLQHYGIEIKSIKATVGPTITLYEIVPKEGIRVSRIRNLEYDIMLSLAATGIRIIAPIPGKGTVGIEVPNADPKIVSMHSVLSSRKFQESKFELPIVFGKTITNEVFMVDLVKMPHLLVAGATGQGKSVGLNAIITSLLYKKHPSVLKLVLIDPKKVEFNIYGDIEKHFLAKLPDGEDAIITDTSKVIETLHSLTVEMDSRYDLLKKAHARHIIEYNEKFINRRLNPEKGHKFLPYIVVIIDEFADLISTAGKEVELPIARIAQLARAVGIHMIIATQRPSVNIITGVIKANFPARVAFKVSSLVDSRTILDGAGANQLVGRGDMLFTVGNDLTRVQCAFVDTPEVENISHFIGEQQGFGSAFYLPEYVRSNEEDMGAGSVDLSKRDPLFEDAARLVVNTQNGSTSNLQRRFSIGYNKAGRIMDQLEHAGIVGGSEGGKPRQVLVLEEVQLEYILKQMES